MFNFTRMLNKKPLFILFLMLVYIQGANANKEEIFAAIKENNINKILNNKNLKNIVNATNINEDTPLLAAARLGNIKIMDLLLKFGANINQLDRNKRDILNIAISRKDKKLASWALKNNIDVTMITSIYEGSALIYACHQGEVEIVKMLIEAKAPLNRINNLGWTALLETTILGDDSLKYQKIAQLLVSAGANKNIKDKNGVSPLEHAKKRGNWKIVKILQ